MPDLDNYKVLQKLIYSFILLTLNSYYRDVAKEAGFKDVAKEAAFKIPGLSQNRSYTRYQLQGVKGHPTGIQTVNKHYTIYVRTALRGPRFTAGASRLQYKGVTVYGYRSNYLRLIRIRLKVKEYADLKSILRAYLISPKKNALRSTTRVNIAARINRVTGYFEENDEGIYEPPFPTGRFKGSSLAKYEGRKPEYGYTG
ncbi:hypothetical protein QBC39DRAFT_333458 [Podospora conica]|nr:hypothetical protein QBC39DRAFT_333458 [Schizothecium conicum]